MKIMWLFCMAILAELMPSANKEEVFVAPSGVPPGAGTFDAPYILREGSEYDLNQIIRKITDEGRDIDVVFKPGIYTNVKLRVLKQGIDTDSIYELEPGESANGQSHLVDGMPYHYRSTERCNQQGENCRVTTKDFALGPHSNARVTLRALKPRTAILDGSAFQINNPEIPNQALEIAGAYFGVTQSGRTGIKSEPIKNIVIDGLVLTGYRNGIVVQHGLGITIENCIIKNIGTHRLKRHEDDIVGVSGFTANGDSQLILVRDTLIQDTWDILGTGEKSRDWPGLMHSVYFGDSKDIIFLNNQFTGSSGPMLKFGYYPIKKQDASIYQYPTEVWQRRGFFIGNTFKLTSIFDSGNEVAYYTPMLDFIHDNSVESLDGAISQPAKGMLFLNNEFRNQLPIKYRDAVAFLRQELPPEMTRVEFPGFVFQGNKIDNVLPNNLVVYRFRGTSVNIESVKHDALSLPLKIMESLRKQDGDAVDVNSTVTELLAGVLKSPDPTRDQMILDILRKKEIPMIP